MQGNAEIPAPKDIAIAEVMSAMEKLHEKIEAVQAGTLEARAEQMVLELNDLETAVMPELMTIQEKIEMVRHRLESCLNSP